MDSYTYSSSWSSSSSNSLVVSVKPVQSFHSVRKPRPKPGKRTGTLPQLPPPKVYRVNSTNFRKVVQRLTGAPKLKSQRLKSMAPPPLPLPVPSFLQSDDNITQPILLSGCPKGAATPTTTYGHLLPGMFCDDSLMANTSLQICSSPSSAWPSFPFLSPGTLLALEQGTVL